MLESVNTYRMRSGFETMTLRIAIIGLMFSLIVAEMDTDLVSNDMTERSSAVEDKHRIADALVPQRHRRFWSMFDWSDSGEKRMSRFLPIRSSKSGFLPMRGKKYSLSQAKSGHYLFNPFGGDIRSPAHDDYEPDIYDESLAEKRAFHAMRGRRK